MGRQWDQMLLLYIFIALKDDPLLRNVVKILSIHISIVYGLNDFA